MAITDEGEYSGVMFAVDGPYRDASFVYLLPEALNNKVILKPDGGPEYSIHDVSTGERFPERGNVSAIIYPHLPGEHREAAEHNLRVLLAQIGGMTAGEVRFVVKK